MNPTASAPTPPHTASHPPGQAARALPVTPGSAGTEAPLELTAPEPHELIEGPSREDLIRRRAYDLYERNGRVDGRELDDWLAAEAELARQVL